MALLTVDDDGWVARRIEIPHEQQRTIPAGLDMKSVIEIVITETKKRKSVEQIALTHQLEVALVEQIVRLYVTHPGVTVDGIMTKMGM